MSFLFCDVLVIGAGGAGMYAALAAAEQGLRVILMEARPWLGGYYDYRLSEFSQGLPHYQRARELAERVATLSNIRVFTHTAMVGAYSNNLVTAFQIGNEKDLFDERYLEIRAQSTVVATGCIERPLLFENNERPGVMQISCAHRLANTYGILPGKQAVFSIGHDLGLEAALDLYDAGLEIAAVADIREAAVNTGLVSALEERGIPYMNGWVARKAQGSPLNSVSLTTLQGTFEKKMECDLLVASAGMTPVTGPLSLAQAELAFDRHTGFFGKSGRPKVEPGIIDQDHKIRFRGSDLFPEQIQVQKIAEPDAPAGGLVFIGRTNAATRCADLAGTGCGFAHAVQAHQPEHLCHHLRCALRALAFF